VTTVRIRSRWAPEGALYVLRDVAQMSERELKQLVKLRRSVRTAKLLACGGRRPNEERVSRLIDRTVAMLLPDLEPRVLRELPFESRVAIVDEWLRVEASRA
jgi:hypothetical protein